MDIKRVFLIYFSPTGGTKQVVKLIGQCFKTDSVEYDITVDASRYIFDDDDLVIIGVPVFGGRVPGVAIDRLKRFSGNNTSAVCVAVYGNRAYEDALLELNNTIEMCGFKVVGAGAFITRHSISPTIAADRPDDQDKALIKKFANEISDKLDRVSDSSQLSCVRVPGNEEYKKFEGLSISPLTGNECNNCGVCIKNCPISAISNDYAHDTDVKKCILCMRCVEICPQNTRTINSAASFSIDAYLKEHCAERKEPEIFI